jgi:pimeloyl-ACP methyl ester carboxylesterase
MRLLGTALTSVALLLTGAAPAVAGGFGSDCDGSNFQCARVSVPLDYTGRVPGSLNLYVERNGDQPQAVFALAGGPGQGNSTVMESFNRDIPLRSDQSLYTFDQRGTGKTGALTCPEIDSPGDGPIDERGEACGARLGARRSLYTTRDSVEDLERVRQLAGDDKITIYGVSYGTKVAVAYALKYPQHVESLVLDSVVEPEGQNPLDLDTFAALPRVLREICRRECRGITADLPGDVQRLAAQTRTSPLRGRWVDARGRRKTVSLTARDLYGRLRSGDLDAGVRTEYPAAIASAIDGDSAPLMRIEHRFDGLPDDPGDEPVPPEALESLSFTLFTATICEEAPFPWQRTAAPADRLAQARAAAAAIPDSSFLPFNRETALTLDDSNLLLQCSRWPAAPDPPALAAGPLPDVPVLVLEGEEDLRTPLEVGQRLATRFPRAVVVSAPKTAHGVLGERGAPCSAAAVRRFFAGRAPGDPCRSFRRATRVRPRLPATLTDLKPVAGTPGTAGRTAAAVVATLEDFYREYNAVGLATERPGGGGLRGGYWSVRGPRATLSRLSLVPGVTVTARFPSLDRPTGSITIGGSTATRGKLMLARNGVLSGTLGGRTVRVRFKPPVPAE